MLLDDIGGEEGQERGGEEEGEVGVEDAMVGLVGAVDEVVVIDPVDSDEAEGEEVDEENGGEGAESGKAILGGDFELEDHDGDDDGEDSVGEGFEACGGEELFRHGVGGKLVHHDICWRGVCVVVNDERARMEV